MNGYLTRKMFYWTMGIVVTVSLAVAGYMIGRMDDLTDKFNHSFTTVVGQVSALNTKMDIVIKKLDL